ncbi:MULTISPECIES: amino acid permease [Mucilaginibacter]|uniref:amino acid permease n=1 Tax=Mucilaginibacter TaxID=423349 RepID=UPI0020933E1F|nr:MULTISPECIES: amino acid permease [Mucilaginibacter]MCO5948433.1 amino acid permease [Mucilaginibacter flavidus]
MAGASKKLGIWTSTSLVVGSMIGSGVFLVPAAMASFGSISLLGWLFSAIGAFFVARVFSRLSEMVPKSVGGPYAYTHYGFGDFAGFMIAWGYYISIITANAAITISFVSAMSTFFPILTKSPVLAVSTGLVAIWFLAWVNMRGVTASGKMQLVTTILKLTPLVVISVGGLFFIRLENFHPFNSSGDSIYNVINKSATIALFSFVGIECATIPADSVENPGKTIGRATMLGLLICTVVYLLGSISIMGIIPAATLAKSPTPYADAAAIMFGNNARYWAAAGMAVAAFGALNGWTLIQGKLPYAIAKDKLFPAIFARQNKKGAPFVGIAVSSTFVSLFMLMNYTKGLVEQFKILILLSTFTTLVPYLFCSAAFMIVRLQTKHLYKGGLFVGLLVGVMAFCYSIWAIAGSGPDTVYYGFLCLMAGLPFYVWIAYKKKVTVDNN